MSYAHLLAVQQAGCHWDRPSTSTIRVRAKGSDSPGTIPLRAEDGTLWISEVDAVTGLSCATGTSGLGGIIVDTLGSNKGYECRLVSKAKGADRGLVIRERGNGLTYAELASALGSSYVMMSPVVGFASRTQGGGTSIADFQADDGAYRYLETLANLTIVSGDRSTSPTALDWRAFAPVGARVWLAGYGKNNAATSRDLYLHANSGGTVILGQWAGFASGAGRTIERAVTLSAPVPEHAAGNTSAYTSWSSAPGAGDGATWRVTGFELPDASGG